MHKHKPEISVDDMSNYENLIFNNVEETLDKIPLHFTQNNIQRLAPQNFPLHTAIHYVSELKLLSENYVQPHKHNVSEINILIPESNDFEYTIQLGDEHYSVRGHRTIWIPAGLIHAANVKKGSGYYICVILESTKNIFWSE